MYLSGIGNKTSIRQQHRATHDASKSATTPVRFLSLLPCPADHRSSTLKSVHWNCSEPILPEQPVPLRQISSAAGPIKFPSNTVLLSQGADPLSQAIRWVNRTYIYKQTHIHIMHVGSYYNYVIMYTYVPRECQDTLCSYT